MPKFNVSQHLYLIKLAFVISPKNIRLLHRIICFVFPPIYHILFFQTNEPIIKIRAFTNTIKTYLLKRTSAAALRAEKEKEKDWLHY